MSKASVDPIRMGMLIDGNEFHGVLTVMRTILAGLDRDRVHTTGIFLDGGPAWDVLSPMCDSVCSLAVGNLYPISAPGKSKYDIGNLLSKCSSFVRAITDTVAAIRRNRIDVMHSVMFPLPTVAGLACRMTNTPCVWHIEGPNAVKGLGLLWRRFGYRFLASVAICCSRFVQETLPPEGRRKSTVIYNAVDVHDVETNQKPGELRRMLGLSDDRPLVALPGAISPRKGHEYFLRGAAKVVEKYPDTCIAVIGSESEVMRKRIALTESLKKLVAELGIADNVVFTGNIPNVPSYLRDCDAIAMPTVPIGLDRGEAFGLVMIEAMAAGAAVVASTAGAPPEVLDHKRTGMLCPPKDGDCLGEAMLYLLDDDQRRQEMVRAARRHVEENFDISRHARAMEAIYEQYAR